MLTITKDHAAGVNPEADVHLFGQEVNPETFAVCKSDLYMKSKDGRDADNVLYGSVLASDRHAGRRFDYLIANPPYGKDWKRDEDDVRAEHARGESGRFAAGLPRISDGQLLFLQHMLAHMKRPDEQGARVAIIMNGSPLFTGDAGSGESEIRRWILENDWLEALVALPEQLFYNTGIATYVWVLSNRKAAKRRGKVLLINATSFWTPRRSLGDKRREIPNDKAAEIVGSHTEPILGDSSTCRCEETPMGDLVADAILWGTAGDNGGAQISLMNIGGVREDLPMEPKYAEGPGEITYAEAFDIAPFGNLLVSMDLTGQQLKDVLEQQYDPGRSRQYLALGVSEGFSYTWDDSQPRGSKVVADSMTLNGEPMSLDATYRVSTLNFLANGGDAFTGFLAGTNILGGAEDLANLVAYFQANPGLTAPEDRVSGL